MTPLARFFLFFAGAGALGAAETVVPAGPAVELPTYVVTETRDVPPPESWRHAQVPGFEILSNAPDGVTQGFVRNLWRFHQAVQVVWPAILTTLPPSSKLILCDRGDKFQAFVPASRGRHEGTAASLCLHDADDAAIVIDLGATVVATATSSTDDISIDDWLSAAASGASGPGVQVDPVRQLKREYVRFLLSRLDTRLPPWLEEGLAQLFVTMQIDDKRIVFARLLDPNAVSIEAATRADLYAQATQMAGGDSGLSAPTADMVGPPPPAEETDFNKFLLQRGLMPLAEFFAVARDAPETHQTVGGRWAAQAQCFVHLCLYGEKQKYTKAFFTFIGRAAKEPVTEAMFRECFGLGFRDMGLRLRIYIENTRYKFAEFPAKGAGLPPVPPLALRDATDAEVGRVKGTVLRLAGHPEAARLAMVAPYVRGERDPALLATLGVQEHLRGNDTRARALLEAAARGKAVDPRAHAELARLRLAESRAQAAATGGKLDKLQVAAVLTPLFTARGQLPPRADVYRLIAETWSVSAIAPGLTHLDVLNEGIRRFPEDRELLYATAALHARHGFHDHAGVLARRGFRLAPNAAARARFAELLATLPPEARVAPKTEK